MEAVITHNISVLPKVPNWSECQLPSYTGDEFIHIGSWRKPGAMNQAQNALLSEHVKAVTLDVGIDGKLKKFISSYTESIAFDSEVGSRAAKKAFMKNQTDISSANKESVDLSMYKSWGDLIYKLAKWSEAFSGDRKVENTFRTESYLQTLGRHYDSNVLTFGFSFNKLGSVLVDREKGIVIFIPPYTLYVFKSTGEQCRGEESLAFATSEACFHRSPSYSEASLIENGTKRFSWLAFSYYFPKFLYRNLV